MEKFGNAMASCSVCDINGKVAKVFLPAVDIKVEVKQSKEKYPIYIPSLHNRHGFVAYYFCDACIERLKSQVSKTLG